MPPNDRLRWRDVRRTTPFRLTLLLGTIFLAGLWATLAITYVLTARELRARSDHILDVRAESLLREPPANLPRRIQAEIANAAPGIGYFGLLSRDGELITGNIRVALPQRPGHPFNLTIGPNSREPIRVLTVRTGNGETIVLGRDISQIRDLRGRLLLILVISGICGTLLMLLAAIALSLSPLRRVRDLQLTSRAIAAGALDQRMPIAGRHDELDQFAMTVNHMVEEVSHVVAQVKSATDAIAHDLRTPLTRVRASLHRARHAGEAAADWQPIIDRALDDIDHVIERFGALLRISELEAAGRRAGLQRLDPAPLLAQLHELYLPLAEDRGVALNLAINPTGPVHADRELLFEAVGNLIDNATKFATSRVTLGARQDEHQVLIEVSDDGAGIPADERDAVLRRFYRAKDAAGVEGTGLGLALVAAILHLHGFALDLDDGSPGLIARIRMPRAHP